MISKTSNDGSVDARVKCNVIEYIGSRIQLLGQSGKKLGCHYILSLLTTPELWALGFFLGAKDRDN